MDEQPSLGQLIWLVRRELEWAHAVDAGHPLRFDVGEVGLEVDVEAKRATKGEAGLDLKVVGIGGRAGGSRESTHGMTSRVRVVLTPRDLRSAEGRYSVSAADTEPPPRRAEAILSDSAGNTEGEASRPMADAVDSESPPDRS